MKLFQKKTCLVSDLCVGPVPHNQTSVMLKIVSEYDQEIPQSETADNPMPADPVAMMTGLVSSASRTDMHTGRVQLEKTCLLLQCNS